MADNEEYDGKLQSNYLSLSLEELQSAYRDLMIMYSSQTLTLRTLESENKNLRVWAVGKGLSSTVLEKIRLETLRNYLATLPSMKKKRGRRRSLPEAADVAELFRLYQLHADPNEGIKPWLRRMIMSEFAEHNLSFATRKRQINALVQKWATRLSRYQKHVALQNSK